MIKNNNLIQMINEEGYAVSMEQVLEFSRESFGRLLAVLEPQVSKQFPQFVFKRNILKGLVPTSLYPSISSKETADLPREVTKLITFLKAQPQVTFSASVTYRSQISKQFQNKHFIRNLNKPVHGVGVQCVAIRLQALTRANVGDLKGFLSRLQIHN